MWTLKIKLLSDTTFGRGDGVAGLVDEEVEHDPDTGLPTIHGRTLKGLLVEECTNLLYSLEAAKHPQYDLYDEAAGFLFGYPGSTLNTDAKMRIGTATLSPELCQAVSLQFAKQKVALKALQQSSKEEKEIKAFKKQMIVPDEILSSWTLIRRQTAANVLGAPEENTLRAIRAVRRHTVFYAPVDFTHEPQAEVLALLYACVKSLRRGGVLRNRGMGRLECELLRDGSIFQLERVF